MKIKNEKKIERNKESKKKHGSSESREKIYNGTQSEIEKELNKRSLSEYRIKDDENVIDYKDEDKEPNEKINYSLIQKCQF